MWIHRSCYLRRKRHQWTSHLETKCKYLQWSSCFGEDDYWQAEDEAISDPEWLLDQVNAGFLIMPWVNNLYERLLFACWKFGKV